MKNGKVAGVSLSTATTKAHAFFRNLQDCFKLLRGTRYATPLCSTEWYSGMRALRACQWPTYELTERARQTLLGTFYTKRNTPLRGSQMWLPEVHQHLSDVPLRRCMATAVSQA